MRITAKLRPSGIKRGVSTKSLYKAMGFKDPGNIDIRDVVGMLELSASGPNDTIFLAAVHKCLSDFYPNTDGYHLKIFDKSGKECFAIGPEPSLAKEQAE